MAVNSTEDEPIEKDTGISHMEATKILDKALQYIVAQDDATIADVLLFKRCCIQTNKNWATKENYFLLCKPKYSVSKISIQHKCCNKFYTKY